MISEFNSILELMEEVDAQLKSKISVFAIGGIVLMYRGLKTVTKDIDLVVNGSDEYNGLRQTLHALSFVETKPEFGYDHFNLSQILVSKDFRIDLFSKVVCKGFCLSPGMVQRAQEVFTLNKLGFHLCSNEDIFLFKTMTEREGDLEDCIALSRLGLDWEVILGELKHQIKVSGNKVWITWVGERLDLLIEKGLNIPIMKEIDHLRDEYFEELEKRLATKN